LEEVAAVDVAAVDVAAVDVAAADVAVAAEVVVVEETSQCMKTWTKHFVSTRKKNWRIFEMVSCQPKSKLCIATLSLIMNVDTFMR
jgi:hypothetical protein